MFTTIKQNFIKFSTTPHFNFYKRIFLYSSMTGALLVGSTTSYIRILGFAMCSVGNVFWILWHTTHTMDKESYELFVFYLIINILSIFNNMMGNNL
jgi:hypothetical protein